LIYIFALHFFAGKAERRFMKEKTGFKNASHFIATDAQLGL
jgi:hypothetical protein